MLEPFPFFLKFRESQVDNLAGTYDILWPTASMRFKHPIYPLEFGKSYHTEMWLLGHVPLPAHQRAKESQRIRTPQETKAQCIKRHWQRTWVCKCWKNKKWTPIQVPKDTCTNHEKNWKNSKVDSKANLPPWPNLEHNPNPTYPSKLQLMYSPSIDDGGSVDQPPPQGPISTTFELSRVKKSQVFVQASWSLSQQW